MIEIGEELIGRVATSRAGRDKGRAFLIVGIADGQHVLLADGGLRKLSKPKKKKGRHIALENAAAPGIREKLREGRPVFDGEIRSCLMQLGYNREQQQEPANAPEQG